MVEKKTETAAKKPVVKKEEATKKAESKKTAETAAPKKKAEKTLKVRMTGGLRGTTKSQRGTVAGLGLKKIGQIRELEDTKCVRGMINAVPHLVEVVE